jgi:UDP-N-acetyl-D-mannosaminuronate dehydrogenase
VEDITDERLAAALAPGRYRASSDTADLADFDIAVISVPTPMREGAPDLELHRASERDARPVRA